MADPITTTYQTIRNALLAWAPWTALVKVGNFPDLSNKSFPGFREVLAKNDYPEVALLQGAFTLKPFGRNSTTVGIAQAFPLVLTFDRMQTLTPNTLKFETLRALVNATTAINSLGYVTAWDVVQGTDNPLGREPWSRGVQRFVTAMQINVSIDLPRATILSL